VNGDPQPVDLRLTDAAKRKWVAFYNEHAREQCELSEDLAAAWSKLEGYAARLALLIHLVRVAAGDTTIEDIDAVDEKSVEAGIVISRWFGDEAARVYEMLGAEGDDQENTERRKLLRIIREHGGEISVRDLMHASRKYRDRSADAKAALEGLAQDGLGEWLIRVPGPSGGRPTHDFRLFETSGNGNTTSVPATDQVTLPLPRSDGEPSNFPVDSGGAAQSESGCSGNGNTTAESNAEVEVPLPLPPTHNQPGSPPTNGSESTNDEPGSKGQGNGNETPRSLLPDISAGTPAGDSVEVEL
jgi:hypothetical protein